MKALEKVTRAVEQEKRILIIRGKMTNLVYEVPGMVNVSGTSANMEERTLRRNWNTMKAVVAMNIIAVCALLFFGALAVPLAEPEARVVPSEEALWGDHASHESERGIGGGCAASLCG
ncbi:hypothetical protein MRX96_037913 [Rhipicephalus microplus]